MRALLFALALLAVPAAAAQTASRDTSRVFRLAQLLDAERLEERVSIQEKWPEVKKTGWFQFEADYPLPFRSTAPGWLLRLEPGGATSYQVTYVNPTPDADPEHVADAAARIVRRYLPDDGPRLDVRRVYVIFRQEQDGLFAGERVLVR